MSGWLHMLVHPGCTGHHGSPSVPGSSPSVPQKSLQANLNVTSAMLHLLADVLRSITILVAGVLIQANVVGNPGRADAVCALLVAAFVALGSLALVNRMFSALNRVCR